MTMQLIGGVYVGGGRDSEGFRTWTVKHLVKSDVTIGPATALLCPGLPQPGEMWLFEDDVDPWAYCTLEAKVTPYSNSPKCKSYWVEQPFSTKPNRKWCKDQQIDDPLLQPPKISGNFMRYSEEATFDRFGSLLMNSSWEQIRGPQVEFDADRIQIEIEQNVIDLDLPLLIALSNTVNVYPLWGAAERMIKFNPGAWSMNFYGQCHKYFTRKLTFEARKDGWDRVVLDEGTKVLNGRWNITGERKWILNPINGEPPNPRNPTHFIRYKDPRDENTRTVLDGTGKPYIPELVSVKEGCTASPQLPTKWLLSGVVNDDQVKSPVILEEAGTCGWLANWEYDSGSFKTITLDYIPPDPLLPPEQTNEWRLVIQGEESIWSIRHSRWKPFGPNTLLNPSINKGPDIWYPLGNIYPPKLTISTGNMPGVRSIQKYEGSDFLLLGVPLLL